MPLFTTKELESFSEGLGISLYLWRITEAEEELIQMLPDNSACVSEVRKRFASSSRRCEWLVPRVLLFREAQLASGILYEANGHPYLSAFPDKFISISHSRGYVALAIATFPIGIDLEVKGSRAYRLREKFLNENELQLLSPMAQMYKGVNEEVAAVMLWSAKEAFFKKDESQTLVALSDIELTLSDDVLVARNKLEKLGKPSSLSFLLTSDFVLSVCR